MPRIGDVVPTFKLSSASRELMQDELVLVVARGSGEHRWQTMAADDRIVELLIDPLVEVLGTKAYVAYMNAALAEEPEAGGGDLAWLMAAIEDVSVATHIDPLIAVLGVDIHVALMRAALVDLEDPSGKPPTDDLDDAR